MLLKIHRRATAGLPRIAIEEHVRTYAEATAKYREHVLASGEGVSTFPQGELDDGNTTFHVSYNGRIWDTPRTESGPVARRAAELLLGLASRARAVADAGAVDAFVEQHRRALVDELTPIAARLVKAPAELPPAAPAQRTAAPPPAARTQAGLFAPGAEGFKLVAQDGQFAGLRPPDPQPMLAGLETRIHRDDFQTLVTKDRAARALKTGGRAGYNAVMAAGGLDGLHTIGEAQARAEAEAWSTAPEHALDALAHGSQGEDHAQKARDEIQRRLDAFADRLKALNHFELGRLENDLRTGAKKPADLGAVIQHPHSRLLSAALIKEYERRGVGYPGTHESRTALLDAEVKEATETAQPRKLAPDKLDVWNRVELLREDIAAKREFALYAVARATLDEAEAALPAITDFYRSDVDAYDLGVLADAVAAELAEFRPDPPLNLESLSDDDLVLGTFFEPMTQGKATVLIGQYLEAIDRILERPELEALVKGHLDRLLATELIRPDSETAGPIPQPQYKTRESRRAKIIFDHLEAVREAWKEEMARQEDARMAPRLQRYYADIERTPEPVAAGAEPDDDEAPPDETTTLAELVKIAADSVDTLRASDIFRVLNEARKREIREPGLLGRITGELVARRNTPAFLAAVLEAAADLDEEHGSDSLQAAVTAGRSLGPVLTAAVAAAKENAPEIAGALDRVMPPRTRPLPATFPSLHLNGTGRDRLLQQLQEAEAAIIRAQAAPHGRAGKAALREALEAVHDAAPHGRDYYTQDKGPPGETYKRARDEHVARVGPLQAIASDRAPDPAARDAALRELAEDIGILIDHFGERDV